MAAEVIVLLHVVPGSKKDQLCGFMEDGRLKIKVAARAVDGKANERLMDYLSEIFKIKKSNITIRSGEFSSDKRISIAGVDTRELQNALKQKLSQDP